MEAIGNVLIFIANGGWLPWMEVEENGSKAVVKMK
jgi:hypothetical protein